MGASPTQIPIFDGHNDALTAANRELLVTGGGDGHLDLPRMRQGHVRGGIFAVFVESRDEHLDLSPEPGVPYVHPLPPRVQHSRAAGITATTAGHLLALEREGAVRVARSIADVDAAATDDGAPAVVLHFEGAEAIDRGLASLETWYAAGLRSLGPVWSRSNAFGHGVPFAFPSSPDTGPGLTPAGHRTRTPLRGARDRGRPEPPQRGRLLGRRAARCWPADRQPYRGSCAIRMLTQPHRRADRRGGGLRWAGRHRVRLLLPAGGLRQRAGDDAAAADRRPRPLRRRPRRHRARRLRLGLRRRHDPDRSSAMSPATRSCSRHCAERGSRRARSERSPGTTGGACSTAGGDSGGRPSSGTAA